jgi:glycosyltransferase involved in cell wall biosynthesis
MVATYHGVYAETNGLKRLYNSVMVRGAAVVANSHYTARLIAERYATPADKITVIHRGTNLRRFDPAAVDPVRRNELRQAWGVGRGERIVLHLARLTGWKGQRILIDATALPTLAGRESAVFVLAGDEQGRAGYRRELEGRIAELGLASRFRIVGHCEDVPAALALADVAVVASIEPEAFGRAAVEAQAMGVPVVVTDLGAAPETVLAPPDVDAASRTGWRVPPGDAGALAGAIAEALALDPADAVALAARARAQAARFSLEAMQEATLELYDRLLPQPA